MNPLLTVITVCRNSEKSIKDTIQSVLDQSFKAFEYIIIDGASTDGTIRILQAYQDLFKEAGICFTYISERDNGIYDAMNKGIRLSHGEYLNFLNSDDRYHSKHVLYNAATELKSAWPDILVGSSVLCFGDGSSYLQIPIKKRKELLGRMPFIHQAAFIRRGLLIDNPYRTKYKLAADYDFFYKMMLMKRSFVFSDSIIVDYSMEGASNQNNKISKFEYRMIKKENLTEYNASPVLRLKSALYSAKYYVRSMLRSNQLLLNWYKNKKQG